MDIDFHLIEGNELQRPDVVRRMPPNTMILLDMDALIGDDHSFRYRDKDKVVEDVVTRTQSWISKAQELERDNTLSRDGDGPPCIVPPIAVLSSACQLTLAQADKLASAGAVFYEVPAEYGRDSTEKIRFLEDRIVRPYQQFHFNSERGGYLAIEGIPQEERLLGNEARQGYTYQEYVRQDEDEVDTQVADDYVSLDTLTEEGFRELIKRAQMRDSD